MLKRTKKFIQKERKQILKSVFVLILVTSWLLAGWPPMFESRIKNKEYSFPPKVEETKAAFSAVTGRGSAVDTTNDNAIAVSPDANITVGKIAIVQCVTDNNNTANGATTFHSLADTDTNTWTRVYEETDSDGSADDGSTTSLWWTKVATQIDTTDSITCTLGANKTDKTLAVFEVTVAAGNTVSTSGTVASPTHSDSGTNTTISSTLSSITSREYLLVGSFGAEGETGKNPDTSPVYTELYDLVSTTSGLPAANIQNHLQYRIATVTGETADSLNVTWTNGTQTLVGFYEVLEATYDQEHFWFRDDDGSESAATGYGTGNLAVDANIGASETFAVGQAFRLRMGLLKNNAGVANLTATPKLQFKAGGTTGSCTTDSWTSVNIESLCSSEAFCQAASDNFTDGTATTRQLDATHTLIGGDMIDADGVANSATFDSDSNADHAEWEWMLDSSNAAISTVYTFRIAPSESSTYANYTKCPTLETDALNPTYTQNRYRWYVDNSSANPTDAWSANTGVDIAENAGISVLPAQYDPPGSTQEIRLRVNMTVGTSNLAISTAYFKLQWKNGTDGDCTTGSWTDVGTNDWLYTSSVAVTDGADISAVLSDTTTGKGEEYVKSKASGTSLNHVAANIGEKIEYDFHIIGGGSGWADATQYSFRVVETNSTGSTATTFSTYSACPTLTTEHGLSQLLRHGKFKTETATESGYFWAD